MRVKIVRTLYPHWGTYSGINQFVKYIDPIKYHIDMQVVSDSDEDFPIQNEAVKAFLRNLIQKKPMPWYKLSDLTAEIRTLVQCWLKSIDIIHFLDGEHAPKFLPVIIRHLCRRRPKVVATYHQPPEVLESLVDKEVLSMLDGITVVSPEQVSFFKSIVPNSRIYTILHGINTNYFRPGNRLREENKLRCITVGHYLRDFNALRIVAEEFSNYKEIEFHVVSSEGSELNNLRNVTFYSGIDDSKLLELYQKSDVLFLPLLQCTANNAILEGIACGLPVLTTSLPSVKEYLTGGEAIMIKDNSPEKFVQAILQLYQDREKRKDMARKARGRAKELDWRKIAPQYEALYLKLAN